MKCPACGHSFQNNLSACPSCGILTSECELIQKELDRLTQSKPQNGAIKSPKKTAPNRKIVQATMDAGKAKTESAAPPKRQLPFGALIAGAIIVLAIAIGSVWYFFIHDKTVQSTQSTAAKPQPIKPKPAQPVVVKPTQGTQSATKSEPSKTPAPVQISEPFKKAVSLAATGDFNGAKSMMEQTVKDKRDLGLVNVLTTMIQESTDDTKAAQALQLFFTGFDDELNQKIPSALNAYDKSYRLYKNAMLFDSAIVALQRTVNLQPDKIDKQYELAMLYGADKRWKEAKQEFKKVVEKDPKNVDALIKLGATIGIAGNWNEAIPFFNNALDIKPNSKEAHYYLTLAYFYTKKSDLAKTHADKARALGYKIDNPILLNGLTQ
jgi:tetratricopeptide (TPR) repeat protein